MTDFLGPHIAVSKNNFFSFKNSVDRLDDSVTTIKVEVKDKVGAIASWGKKNDYPQQVIASAEKNASATSGLQFLRKVHYGNGLVLIKNQATEDGKKAPMLVPFSSHPEIAEFFKKSKMKKMWKEIILDLEWFSIAFPEYILSNNYKTINRVKRHKAAWCRFEVMNKENGLVEHVYISEKFGKGSVDLEGEFVSKVPLIDSYWTADEVREYCKLNGITKFVRPCFYPLLNEAFYPKSALDPVIKSGWMDVANSVPELKQSIFEKQMVIDFLIEVDERYFESIYKTNWQDFSPEKRKEIRNGVIDTINDSLTGSDKAGKSIQSMTILGVNGKPYPAIKITPIDNKLKDGSYLPEAEAANSEVLFALGVDPTLIGAGIPGGKLGSGGGSDKREAFTILSALKKTDRETTLEIFEFIQEYNGWDEELEPAFENTILTTLDANPTGKKNVTS